MQPISKENEFSKLTLDAGSLECTTKSKFLKFGYYYYYSGWIFFSSKPVVKKLQIGEIRKMRIMSMWIVSIVFFILAAMIFGLGFLNGKDKYTGETIPPPTSQIMTATIIALVLAGLGFLYLKSKTGRLKVLQASLDGTPMVLYSSTDKTELEELKKTLENAWK